MRELAIDYAHELAVAVRVAQINESTHPHMVRHRTILLALLITLGMPSIHAQTKDLAPEAQLNNLLDEDLDATFRRNPIQATVRGVPGYNHLLQDLSLATLERERARERHALERLKALGAKALRGQDRISYELLLDKMELAVEAQQFTDADALVLTTLGGLHNVLPRAAQVTPFHKPEDYRDDGSSHYGVRENPAGGLTFPAWSTALTSTRSGSSSSVIAVVVPEVVELRWWQWLLHRRKAARLRSALLKRGDRKVVVVNVPCYVEE